MKTILVLTLLGLSLSANLRFTDTPTPTAKGQQIKGLAGAKTYVTAITSTYESLVSAVKSSKSDTYKAMWKNAGFKQIDLRGTVKVSEGIQEIYYYDKYRESIQKTFKVPERLQPFFQEYLFDDETGDHAAWSKTELEYNAEDLTDDKYVRHFTFLSNHRDDGKADATSIVIEFKFDLADEVYVINHSLSVAGGIYQQSKDEIVTKPRAITNDDLEALMNIATMMSFRLVGYQLGIVLTLPTFD